MQFDHLDAAEIPAALALVRECGWNQVAADWDWFLAQGEVLKHTQGDAVAATAAVLPYASFGWISMVLVSQAQRRQGIATALLEACVARLRELGLLPVLDATPAGREVYRRMGFVDGWAITRWRRTASGPMAPTAPSSTVAVRPLAEHDWPQITTMDAAAFGADRSALLRHLSTRSTSFACVAERGGRIAGYLLGRDGRIATQIGPVMAVDAEVAQALAGYALPRITGTILIDVLDQHGALAAQLQAAGFAIERGYTRMAFGAAPHFGDAQRTVAIAGPELG